MVKASQLFFLASSSKILKRIAWLPKRARNMHTKISLRTRLSVGALPVLFCALTLSSPAWAGFQWVPPESLDQALPPTPAQTLYANPPAPAPMPAIAPAPAPQIIEAPMPAAPAPMADLPAPEKSLAPAPQTLGQVASEQGSVVRGFASNVPLSVAMRQILPQEYGFSVAQDVSLGTLVSWKGGAPWRQVTKDMLLPAGLTIQEQGQMIHVVPATEAEIAASGRSSAPMRLSEKTVSGGAFESVEAGKPMSLVPPSSAKASLDPLPSRAVGDAAPRSMGYLAPPSDVLPAPSLPRGASASSSVASAGTFDNWTAEKGDMLRKVLENWGRRANVEVSWQAEYDFPLQASVSLNGSYEEAVRGLLVGFENARPQPFAQLHNNNTAGQAVLVVQARGNNYNE